MMRICYASRTLLLASRVLQVKDAIKKVQNLPVPTVLAADDAGDSVLKEFDMAPQSSVNPWKPIRQY